MKICSLIASGTETLFALGLGDQIIGVTEYCNYPPEAKTRRVVTRGVIDIYHMTAREVDNKVQELARTGKSAYTFDTEYLQRVKPELILTQDMCRSCDLEAKDVFCAIENMEPKPRVLVLNPRRLSDIFTNIGRIAEATNLSDRGVSLVGSLQGRIQRVDGLVSPIASKPRVLYLEWTEPPSPAGDWIPEQIARAGGVPQLSEPGVAPSRLNWQIVEQCDPDVIFVGPCSHNIPRILREMPNVAKVEAWWRMRAVRSGNVYLLASEYFDRPGPRVIDGIEIMAQILHPQLNICSIPTNAVAKFECPAEPPERPAEIIDLFHPYDLGQTRHELEAMTTE